MEEKVMVPEENPTSEGGSGIVTTRLSSALYHQLMEKSRSRGVSPEDYVSDILSKDLSGEERLEPIISEVRKLSAKNDQLFLEMKEELQEINEKNREAYEGMARSLKPDKKEWGIIAGAGTLVAVLLIVIFAGAGKNFSGSGPPAGGLLKPGPVGPAQMSPKDRYTYFVGRWYLGVRDRMSAKERLFLENYLKPFDNFDEDLKDRKKAGL